MLPEIQLAQDRAAIARAGKVRKRHPDDPEAQAQERELRAAYRARKLEEYIREAVDAAPPLTPEQRHRLSVLLCPGVPA